MENPITSRYGTSHQRANLPWREHCDMLRVSGWRLALLMAVVSHLVAGAQQSVERERKMWDLDLIELAEKNHSDSTTTPGDNSKPVYESLDGPTETVNEGDSIIGITIWRLRPSEPSDEARFTVVEQGQEESWTPVRVNPDTALSEGTNVRLTIEASRTGYLYVITRERFADSSRGEPYLIFPTLRTRSGNNEVVPGRLVGIPDQRDMPPYFTLQRSRRDQTTEELLVLLTPNPLQGISLASDATALPAALVEKWEHRWSRKTERFNLKGIEEIAWSREEQAAGLGTRALRQQEPMPQTLYRVDGSLEEPLLVKLSLRFAE